MQRALAIAIVAMFTLFASVAPVESADKLEGEARQDARKRLREVKREWKDAGKSEKFTLLQELSRLPDRRIGGFLGDVMTDADEDDDVAGKAAWALAMHGDPDDAGDLKKAFSRARTPERRAAVIRWMGLFGEAELKEIRRAALDEDLSATAAVRALTDVDTDEAWNAIGDVASSGKNRDAKTAAVGLLLQRGDERGLAALKSSSSLEDAAAGAHFAVGTDLEVDALEIVLGFAKGSARFAAGKRPHYFGSLLARLERAESHEMVKDAAGGLNKQLDIEIGWWLISVNRASIGIDGASRWLRSDDKASILNGLRYIQRQPEPYTGDDLELANERLAPLLDHDDDDIVAHAMFSAAATGACTEKLAEKVAEWIKDDDPYRRAGALLAAGRGAISDHAGRAMELLEDDVWYVRSAALDCLLRLRPDQCAIKVLELARREQAGRIFAECIALLADLTGQDHGDLLDKWGEWLVDNEKYETRPRALETLRGVPYSKMRNKTAATFYGLEINSTNVQFAVDRSISMSSPVRREPTRRDFEARKQEILKRRPEVGRMMQGGLLPRFYVAAAEIGAALDGMTQDATIGITLFNHEAMHGERVKNAIDKRRGAVNWMLSTSIQGGTDIKGALLEIIESGECDTILLLSDGEPMSLSILEMIARKNAVKRVDIMAVSIEQERYHRHYLNALATRHYGQIIDAEPEE